MGPLRGVLGPEGSAIWHWFTSETTLKTTANYGPDGSSTANTSEGVMMDLEGRYTFPRLYMNEPYRNGGDLEGIRLFKDEQMID